MTDTSKIQFEQWHKRETQAFVAAGEVEAAQVMEGFKESMWSVWEASRQAVVVELPDTVANTGTLTSNAVLSYKRECKEAIEAAGLRCEVKL
ncbi:hypothetical protein NJC38_02645 [Pseudomonas sp. 21LCFQ010]|uniref:hypothetical protein n=1 Tax=Pseudomonas sp. 21LCFQ010 TaxID=2957506 RepID=UPI0020974DF2|nr:hypothetical protein [Pseudomonas sp. 21LCFQ010]MCO8161049.1 hypothetical protein [Pseudomonas sp. 21LCFQ010]